MSTLPAPPPGEPRPLSTSDKLLAGLWATRLGGMSTEALYAALGLAPVTVEVWHLPCSVPGCQAPLAPTWPLLVRGYLRDGSQVAVELQLCHAHLRAVEDEDGTGATVDPAEQISGGWWSKCVKAAAGYLRRQ